MFLRSLSFLLFFFNDTATTEIYTLSLHDALPISSWVRARGMRCMPWRYSSRMASGVSASSKKRCMSLTLPPELKMGPAPRSEEHTSELQSQSNLVCRLLLEKKNTKNAGYTYREHN